MISSQGIGQNQANIANMTNNANRYTVSTGGHTPQPAQLPQKKGTASDTVKAKTVSVPKKDVIQEMTQTADDLKAQVEKERLHVQQLVEQLQKGNDLFDRKLKFNVNEELDKVVIKVIDSNTDKVIKEIPSPEIQKMQLRIKDAIGFLFDERL